MKILSITQCDSKGEQFNGYLIHRELLKQGHQSKMAVMVKQKDDPHIHILGNKLTQFYDKIVSVIEMVLGLQRLLPISGYCLFFKKYYWKADLIHLHLIHSESFFSLLLLPIITRRHKVVLTLHDPWIMTGHCIHPFDCQRWRFGCGSCPNLVIPFYVNRDSTAFMWRLKKMLLDHSNLTIVVASNWMAEFVSLSPLVSRFPCQIIPFGMDVNKCNNSIKNIFRERYSIPKDAILIAFRYSGKDDKLKGWTYIEQALLNLHLNNEVYLVVFDKTGGMENLAKRYHILEFGWVSNREIIFETLAAVDLFLMPSVAEAFGMMAIESMACGTPVIVFEGTALPEVVHAPYGGIAVPRDSDALAKAIETVINDRELYDRLVENGRKIVQGKYTVEKYIQRHIELYMKLMSEQTE